MNTSMLLFSTTAACVFLAVIAHLTLPRHAAIERSVMIPARPAVVYSALDSAQGYDQIKPFRAEDPALRTVYSGPARGVGSTLTWSGKRGRGSQTITAVVPHRRIKTEIYPGSIGRSEPIFTIEPAAIRSNATWIA